MQNIEAIGASWGCYYPSSPTFCFNRNVLRVYNAFDQKSFTLEIYEVSSSGAKTGTSYTDTRNVSNDEVRFDISRYMQIILSHRENNETNTYGYNIHFTLTDDDGISVSATFRVYWGGSAAGQTYSGGVRIVRYYTNIKNTPQMWLFEGYQLYQSHDHGEEEFVRDIEETSKNLITALEGTAGLYEFTLSQYRDRQLSGVFDATFDATFRNILSEDTIITRIIFDCSTKGVFLKWLDNTGLWLQYMFKEGNQTFKTSNIGDDYETFRMDDDAFGYYGVLQGQGKTQTHQQELCAPNVHKLEREMLRSILASPLVYLCLNLDDVNEEADRSSSWLPVRIVAGSFTDDNSEYNDFTFTIQYPDNIAQRL